MMITFEKALEIAREIIPNTDEGSEFEGGYTFSLIENRKKGIQYGGPDSPICVLKKDGSIVPTVVFMLEHAGEYLKDFELQKDGTWKFLQPQND